MGLRNKFARSATVMAIGPTSAAAAMFPAPIEDRQRRERDLGQVHGGRPPGNGRGGSGSIVGNDPMIRLSIRSLGGPILHAWTR